MLRLLRNLVLLLLLLGGAACAVFILRAADPVYAFEQLLNYPRYQKYDALIAQVGKKEGVDPLLIKAVIWRESGFHNEKVGKNGERGLMQVTEGAAKDWARETKRATFVPTDLFSPIVNLEAGTWYLKKALQRYAGKDEPATFALAEYNAGKRRVDRWLGATASGTNATAGDLRDTISFPGTRSYVEAIMERYRAYQKDGHL